MNMNDFSLIQEYLNKLIINIQKERKLDEDDFINLLTIIYNEYISEEKNVVIRSLIITLLYNYINILNNKEQEEAIYHIYNAYYLPSNDKNKDVLDNAFDSLMTPRILNIKRDI